MMNNSFRSLWLSAASLLAVVALLSVGYLLVEEESLSGGCSEKSSPNMQKYFDDNRLITFCEMGDADQMRIESAYFKPDTGIKFSYAGYPSTLGVNVFVEGKSGQRVPLTLSDAREKWLSVYLNVPAELNAEEGVRIVAVDQASGPFGWAGIGKVESTFLSFDVDNLLILIAFVVFIHAILAIWLAWLRQFTPADLAPLWLMIILGFVGWAAFGAYYVGRWVGIGLSCTALLLSITQFARILRRWSIESLHQASRFLMPVSSFALFIVLIGYYPYSGGANTDWIIAAIRWGNHPIDNWIPKIFADQIWAGRVAVPMVGDWTSSDRPPLQTGIYLLFYPLAPGHALLYQVVSSVLQAMVFVPACLIFKHIGLSKAMPFGLFALGITSLMALHTLFVWPKLLSAAYLLSFYLVAMTPLRSQVRNVWENAAFTGAAAAFAMLCHGGAIFALLAMAIFYLLCFKRISSSERMKHKIAKYYIAPLAVSLFVFLPWMIYQRFSDPPGDRLVKWHLAGRVEISNMTVSQAISHAYSQLTLRSWIDGRIENFDLVFGKAFDFFYDFFDYIGPSLIGSVASRTEEVVSKSFLLTSYSFWWFSPLVAIVVWVIFRGKRFSSPEALELRRLAAAAILTLLIWCVLMFLPGSTVLHQGTFFPWLALFICSVCWLWQVSPALFFLCTILNSMIFAQSYLLGRLPYSSNIDLSYCAIAGAAFLMFFLSCLAQGDSRSERAKLRRLVKAASKYDV